MMITSNIPPKVNQSPFLKIGDFGTNMKKALTAKKNSDAPAMGGPTLLGAGLYADAAVHIVVDAAT